MDTNKFMYDSECRFIIDGNKSAILLLIGKGELEDKIKEKVKKLNLQKYVKFLGVKDDVNELMMAMDLLLFPSFYEGLPVVLVESQSTRFTLSYIRYNYF